MRVTWFVKTGRVHIPNGISSVFVGLQWRKDGVAAASSDGGPTGGRTVLEFLVINFSVCLVLLRNCYIIIYIALYMVQPLVVVFQ